jgi:GTP-binding protein
MSLSSDPLRITSAEFVAGATSQTSLPAPSRVEIAFLGRSNVGKSSLLNALCQRKNLFRTSSTPGCTRQLGFFSARTKDQAELTLVDVPGYGYAARSKAERRAWADLIDGYLAGRPTLRAAALLIDGRRGVEDEERDLLAALTAATPQRVGVGVVCVLTKLDKVPAAQRQAIATAVQRELGIRVFGFGVRLPETHAPVWQALRVAASLASE